MPSPYPNRQVISRNEQKTRESPHKSVDQSDSTRLDRARGDIRGLPGGVAGRAAPAERPDREAPVGPFGGRGGAGGGGAATAGPAARRPVVAVRNRASRWPSDAAAAGCAD